MALNRPPVFDPLRFVSPVGREKSSEQCIAEIAYFRAMQRNFAPGHELEDWLAAENEFKNGVAREKTRPERSARQNDAPAAPGPEAF